MKIGILETGHAPEEMKAAQGDYADMFARLLADDDLTFQNWDVEAGHMPTSASDADGWLITGSKHGAYEDHPWIAGLESLIREIYEDGRPLIGVCFGHQIIAQALGGKVEKFAGGWSVGRQDYRINGEHIPLNAWHQDQVTELPEGAKVVGESDFCANAALLYDDRIFTIQPHPEYDSSVITGLIEHRGGKVPPQQIAQARDDLDKPLGNDRFARRMIRFFKERRIA